MLDIAANKFAGGGCKLSLLQKDLKLAINMSDAVDQPLHVSSAVNEVSWMLYRTSQEVGFILTPVLKSFGTGFMIFCQLIKFW